MRCVVTAGPTYEPLDDVRRLTNFSTGRLGCELARHLGEHGHEVRLLVGEQAAYRGEIKAAQVERFTTTANLAEILELMVKEDIGAIFHAAAVSDFGFGKVWVRSADGKLNEVKSSKISTREGHLLAELVPTPKIILQLRKWFPTARIIGWKFETEGGRGDVIERAKRQIAESKSDACVANGPAYGPGFGLVDPTGKTTHLENMPVLFDGLERLIA
jgi:phosphopantothenoylcysteine decarboxylase/phosphopantothenate--cysteine ligase